MNKQILTSIVAVLVALLAVNFAIAGELNVSIDEVSVNDVVGTEGSVILAGSPGEVIPIKVLFTSNSVSDIEDAKVTAWIDGYKSDISTSTGRFDMLYDNTYIKRLSLTLPDVFDMDEIDEGLTLHIRIADRNNEIEETYTIRLQRENYVLDLLSIDAPSRAEAGDVVAIDVVLKNIGGEELEDTFVTASIPELGVSKKAYFGDLAADDNLNHDDDIDARERRIYLVIPSDSLSGDYDLVVKASNYDITETVTEQITIDGLVVDDEDDDGVIDTSDNDGMPSSIIVLTIVLIVIFVVLLIVLIVLLTRKPAEKKEAKEEDFGETSYY